MGGIGSKAVDGFGGNGDKAAAPQGFHRALNCLIIEFHYI
jgi:hypothetical protein